MNTRPGPNFLFRLLLLLCVLLPALPGLPQKKRPPRSTAPLPSGTTTRLQRPYLIAQLGHASPVSGVAFSPNNRYVLTGSLDNTARLWELETGKELRRFEGHLRAVFSVAYAADGRYVLTGSLDKTVRLWDVETGKEIQRFEGHTAEVTYVTLSRDSRFVLTASMDGTARLWKTATGKEVRRFEKHAGGAASVAFSPDERLALTAGVDGTARLWEIATGKEIRRFTGHTAPVQNASFSPDGRFVLTGSDDRTARLWDTFSGKEIRRFTGHTGGVLATAFAPDGRSVLTGSQDGAARTWQAANGNALRRFEGHQGEVGAVCFSRDGRMLLTGSTDHTARLWDVATGKEKQRFEGRSASVSSVSFSPDERFLLIASLDGTVRLWEVATGREIRRFTGHTKGVITAAFSGDGRTVVTGSDDDTARLWETATGKELRRFTGHTASIWAAHFSGDGRYVLTGSLDKTARLWDAVTGKELRRFEGHTEQLSAAVFSPDGQRILTGSYDKTARLWETATGKEIRRFTGHTQQIESVAFSPDGLYALSASADKTARLWDVNTGKELQRFAGHAFGVNLVDFSPDGRFVLTGGGDNTARLWETATGHEVRMFQGHLDSVWDATFSHDGHFLLTGSLDGTVRLWSVNSSQELCSLIISRDNIWAVVDRTGRYDAPNGGDVEGLHWVVSNQAIKLSQLKARYFDPHLLAKYLGSSEEPIRPVAAFDNVRLYPEVALTAPAAGSTKFQIGLINQGGGIGRVVVLVNGKEVQADARGRGVNPNAAKAALTFDIGAYDRLLLPGADNTVDVVAYNTEGYLASRGMRASYHSPKKAPADPPQLYAIVCGIGDYSSDSLHLNLPPNDARQIAAVLELGAKRLLLSAKNVHVSLFSSDKSDKRALQPTKANLQKAFLEARQARPGDILVVYLSGHGVAVQDAYCYLTQEARSFDLSDPVVRKQAAISSEELAEWTRQIPAFKQVMILDTCAAGAAAKRLLEHRDLSDDPERALDRLKDRTGFYVLMGCASDAVSYEASQYGQGVLTYALLQGMQGAKLREGEFVDVSPLFEYAADVVPQLIQGLGGIQSPQILTPMTRDTEKGLQRASFDIGQLKAEDRRQIVLPRPRPLVLRPLLINPGRARDDLNLSTLLARRLREASSTTQRGRTLVYVDTEELPGAIIPSGTYMVEGETVKVRLVLTRDDAEIAHLMVEGSKADLPGLAARMAQSIADATR